MPLDGNRPLAPPRTARTSRLILGPLALLVMGTIWGLGIALAKIAGQNGAHPVGLIIWETIGSGILLFCCFTFAKRDLRGKAWPAEDVHALSLANMGGECATVTNSAEILAALPR